VDFEWRLRAAAGYAELGMNRESMAELNAIEMPSQAFPEVLQLRLHHLMREKKWAPALKVSWLSVYSPLAKPAEVFCVWWLSAAL